jgi:hypothetical protein
LNHNNEKCLTRTGRNPKGKIDHEDAKVRKHEKDSKANFVFSLFLVFVMRMVFQSNAKNPGFRP